MVTLPDYKKIAIRNDVDRFGFSNLLADSLSFSYTPRSFCTWLHGWIWWDSVSEYDLSCNGLPYDIPIVVAKTEQKLLLNSLGYLKVYVDGLPFSYTTYTGVTRNENSLLSFIPHESDSHPVSHSLINDYLDYLVTIKESFDEVFVCIFWGGPVDKILLDSITIRGLKYVFGANPYDKNSLVRMRTLLDYFNFVTTPVMGSHVVYAAYCGCKVSICGSFISTRGNDIPTNNKSQEYFDRLVEVESLDWVKKNFLFLFYNHPKEAVDCSLWAKTEIANKSLTNDELIDILGWSFNGQVKGYFRGLKNRIIRAL